MRDYVKGLPIDAAIITDIVDATYQFIPDFDLTQLRDALSTGQLASKLWVEDQLLDFSDADIRNILVVGGWIGTLPRILLSSMEKFFTKTSFDKCHITSIDIDPLATAVASVVNKRYSTMFTAVTLDMFDLEAKDYAPFNVIINTSCEHVVNLTAWSDRIPKDKIVVAQSNDFFDCPQHVNCVRSVKELKDQLNLSHIEYLGSKTLEGMYTRFMVIGIK